MNPRPFRRLAALLALAAAAALAGGCTSLPPLPERDPTRAFLDTRGTALGRLAEASLAEAGPGESGFRLLPSGPFALDARLALIARAERSLDVQYYQIVSDSVGRQFLRALRDAALRGVRVRLLVDDFYTAGEDEMFASFASLANVEVRLFNPLPARGASVAGRFLLSLNEFTRINRRMHNKLFVADNRFSVSGGRNMGDEYFMRSLYANYIDMDVIAAGPVVRELSEVFDRYWNSDAAYPIGAVVRLPFTEAAARRRFAELVADAPPAVEQAEVDPFGRRSVEAELAAGRLGLTPALASVLADAPIKVTRRGRDENVSTVTRSALEAFAEARTELVIASPYFIPGKVGMAAMKESVDRGVRVVVLTNGLGATDSPLVHWGYARYRREMLRLGITLYELAPRLASRAGNFGDFGPSFGRLHAKIAIIDRRLLFVGSMNLDARSAWSNTELGLLIESPTLAEGVYGLLDSDRGASVYKLRLAADGETIEWVSPGVAGAESVTADEPDNSWLLRLRMWLLRPFASEDLL